MSQRFVLAFTLFCIYLLVPLCRSKTSPGCKAGLIWDGTRCRQPRNSTSLCQDGEHSDTILTYILRAETFNVIPRESYQDFDGSFIELQIPKSAIPGTVPYLTNDVDDGQLFQDVLNTTQFMDEWVEMSARAPPGLFANPLQAVAHQCFTEYQGETEQNTDTPPNAMIRFDKDTSKAVVVDIFDVTSTDTEYILTVRRASILSELGVPEGQCHRKQDLKSPHYHHVSLCCDIILDYPIDDMSQLQGGGMTAFIKRVGQNPGGTGGLTIGSGGNGGTPPP